MFDKQFQNLWWPQNVHISQEHSDGTNFDFIHKEKECVAEEEGESVISDVVGTASILVGWDDCLIADYVNRINKSVFEYTVEIR